jgi:hypothetical protein
MSRSTPPVTHHMGEPIAAGQPHRHRWLVADCRHQDQPPASPFGHAPGSGLLVFIEDGGVENDRHAS